MRAVIVIPARYASTRFPAKVLASLHGKPIIQWVWERASKATLAERVIVAVDDQRVYDAVVAFGGEAVMTQPDHPSGTDRIHEAVQHIDADLVINVQGDEPMIDPGVIDALIQRMIDHPESEMGTVAVVADRAEIADNPNNVKVVIAANGEALYFSRSMIPYLREGGTDMPVYKHWGIYAYRRTCLEKFVAWPEGNLEKCEKLEQLRALENGIRIQVLTVDNIESIGIDTPEDLTLAETRFHP